MVKAVQKPNAKFVVEEIVPVPGRRIFGGISYEPLQQKKAAEQKSSIVSRISQKDESRFEQVNKPVGEKLKAADGTDVVVTATGHTSAGKPISDIPIGTFFTPYQGALQTSSKKLTTLILEPSARAIAGNGGTAVSAPVSRAILKKGNPTQVLFRPQSVAIAGVGGRAHAAADLIIDYVE
ncbi:uncharacterized protein LOC119648058 [Hermetia illucens]|nr:uncharacterized protein LOC119648058 [Hermetia illucens]